MSILFHSDSSYELNGRSDAYKALLSRVDPNITFKLSGCAQMQEQQNEDLEQYRSDVFKMPLNQKRTPIYSGSYEFGGGNLLEDNTSCFEPFRFGADYIHPVQSEAIVLSNEEPCENEHNKEYIHFKSNCIGLDLNKLSEYFGSKKPTKPKTDRSKLDTNETELMAKDNTFADERSEDAPPSDKIGEEQVFLKPTRINTPDDKNESESSTDWNYFSLRRTCFRGMSAYYKELFEPMHKEWNRSRFRNSKLSMSQLVAKFISTIISKSNHNFELCKSDKFVDSMITVLHSHRHKKNDDFIKSRDFTKIRKVLYSFSTSAKKEFLSDKYYAFIFAYFYENDGLNFVSSKSVSKPVKFKQDLETEFENLYKIASKTLSEI